MKRPTEVPAGLRPRRRTVMVMAATAGLASMAGLGCGFATDEPPAPAAPATKPVGDGAHFRHLRHKRAALLRQQRAAFSNSESSFFASDGDADSITCHCTSPFARLT